MLYTRPEATIYARCALTRHPPSKLNATPPDPNQAINRLILGEREGRRPIANCLKELNEGGLSRVKRGFINI